MTLQAKIILVTGFQQNCSIFWCTETMKGVVIDPGGDVERILAVVDDEGVELEKVLITHAHLDHAGGARELADERGIPIEGPHLDDKFLADTIPEQWQKYGPAQGQPFTPDRWLTDGETVSFGNITMDVYHCPGHTPGHVIFHDPQSAIAIVGDVLFQGSIGRTDFEFGNHDDLIQSIKTKLWPLGNDVTFIPGHGPTSTFGDERRSNPFVGDNVLNSLQSLP